MDSEKTTAQMRKGVLEFCVLSVISRGEVYASDIIKVLKEAKLIVVEGTLYPILIRLIKSGLVSFYCKKSTLGPPRKYYSLTEDGVKILLELKKSWNSIVAAVDVLTKK